MGSENNYDESAGGVTIDQERSEYHLRCLVVDCEWRAEEVADFIKDQQAKIKALCEIAGVGHAKIMQLEESLRVLAEMLVSMANNERLVKMTEGSNNTEMYEMCLNGALRLMRATEAMQGNAIAHEAVRKARSDNGK